MAHPQQDISEKGLKIATAETPCLRLSRCRAFAAIAIICLLAIPIAVPIAVMKATGKSGRKWASLEDAITGPEVAGETPIANEETTPQEVKESFLKVTDKSVS